MQIVTEETICMNCKSVFWTKKTPLEQYFKLLSAEIIIQGPVV